MLAEANGFGAGQWQIEPGMGFAHETKWWGQRGPREEAHNGVDLKFYMGPGDSVRYLDGRSLVPVMDDGAVINVTSDFLGHSVFVSHGEDESGLTLVSAYGHMVPAEGLEAGMHLKRGDIIGKLSEYNDMPVPPHLHLSLLIMHGGYLKKPDWQDIGVSGDLRALDPLSEQEGR